MSLCKKVEKVDISFTQWSKISTIEYSTWFFIDSAMSSETTVEDYLAGVIAGKVNHPCPLVASNHANLKNLAALYLAHYRSSNFNPNASKFG